MIFVISFERGVMLQENDAGTGCLNKISNDAKRKDRLLYLTICVRYSLAGSTTFPCTSTGFSILKHARIDAAVSHTDSRTMKRPGLLFFSDLETETQKQESRQKKAYQILLP